MTPRSSAVRPEHEVLADLASLCASPGYIHVVALLSFRHAIVVFGDELTAQAMSRQFSGNHIIPAEITTLIGLMMQAPINFALPGSDAMARYLERTEALLHELHEAIVQPGTEFILAELESEAPSSPFTAGKVLREIMFYGGLSAYAFQYRDMAPQRYSADADWLLANRGVRLDVAHAVCRTVVKILQERVVHTVASFVDAPPEHGSMLSGFTFSSSELASRVCLPIGDVLAVLDAFSLPEDERNSAFTSLHEFNVAYAYPLIRKSDDEFVLLQHYSFAEAFYSTPSYWILGDEAYTPQAARHRGDFTEKFAFDRLVHVFGPGYVFRNVEIVESKGTTIGEIDVLVLFGDHAIVVQAKSKRLTLAARSGNEVELRKDFKGAVEDAVAQARKCADAIVEPAVTLVARDGSRVPLASGLRSVLPVCVVADHYPALAFQSSQFLDLKGYGVRGSCPHDRSLRSGHDHRDVGVAVTAAELPDSARSFRGETPVRARACPVGLPPPAEPLA